MSRSRGTRSSKLARDIAGDLRSLDKLGIREHRSPSWNSRGRFIQRPQGQSGPVIRYSPPVSPDTPSTDHERGSA